jgi:hypothetical protein
LLCRCRQCPNVLLTTMSLTARSNCHPCTLNQYSVNQAGGPVCAPLPLGTILTYTVLNGAVMGDHFKECGPGTYANMNVDPPTCTPCPALEVSDLARNARCRRCALGWIRSDAGTKCTPCSAGRYSNTSGSDECRLCPPGRKASQMLSKNSDLFYL